MLDVDTRSIMGVGAGAAAAATGNQAAAPGRLHALSAAALKVADEPTAAAYSPIVLAGTVRLIEFALVVLVGAAVYVGYVVPIEGFEWHYFAAVFGIACNMMVAVAMVHWHYGFFANWLGNQKGEGFEYHILALAIALAIMIRGSGAFSFDRALSN